MSSRVCPECGSPEISEGQPSQRIFFGCGSYTYHPAPEKLRDQTEVCQLRAGMREAWKLVHAMAGQEYWQRAEDWLEENREHAPRETVSANAVITHAADGSENQTQRGSALGG